MAIANFDVAYTGEMYRAGVLNRNAADRLDFQLSLNATSLTTGTWTDYDALDFSSPVVNTTVGAKDGNGSAFRSALSFRVPNLTIANGATFWIRWSDFDVAGLDDGLAVDDLSITPRPNNDVAPQVSSTSPADGAVDVAVDSDVSVTFSEPVTVSGTAFDVTCSSSGTHTGTVSGGPTTYTIDPDANFHQDESCTVTVDDAGVSDADANDPPDHLAADATFLFRVANPAPTYEIVAGPSCLANGGTFIVSVHDLEVDPALLTLTRGGNSNTALVPNAAVSISGTVERTIVVTVADRKTGVSVLAFTLSDGVNDVAFEIKVQVGTNADDSLAGTDGSDLLMGGNGADALSGLGGGDVLCGGNGNDALKGGAGQDLVSGDRGDDALTGDSDADRFSGGLGADTSADLSTVDGDTSDGT